MGQLQALWPLHVSLSSLTSTLYPLQSDSSLSHSGFSFLGFILVYLFVPATDHVSRASSPLSILLSLSFPPLFNTN
jgi:hypothetical protein